MIIVLVLAYLLTAIFVESAPRLPATTDSLMSTTLQQIIHFHEHTTGTIYLIITIIYCSVCLQIAAKVSIVRRQVATMKVLP